MKLLSAWKGENIVKTILRQTLSLSHTFLNRGFCRHEKWEYNALALFHQHNVLLFASLFHHAVPPGEM